MTTKKKTTKRRPAAQSTKRKYGVTEQAATVNQAPAGTTPAGLVDETGTPRVLNCLPSPGQERDFTLAHARAAGLPAAVAGPLPSQVDLREPWWEIGNQRSTGSCVGWAMADSVLRYLFVKSGMLAQQERLSVRFIWTAARERDEFVDRPETFIETAGTSLKAALDVARLFGCVREDTLRFDPPDAFPGEPEVFYLLAAQFKIASYETLIRERDAWRGWLANEKPIMIRVEVDRTWMRATQTQGLLEFYNPFPSDEPRGHAAALVGYTQDGNFIVRNSWGPDWGDQGFGYATPEYLLRAVTEAYGVRM